VLKKSNVVNNIVMNCVRRQSVTKRFILPRENANLSVPAKKDTSKCCGPTRPNGSGVFA